jgi:hypothetical protein
LRTRRGFAPFSRGCNAGCTETASTSGRCFGRQTKYSAADVRNLGSSQTSMLAITIDARSIVPVADAYAQAGIAAPIAIARALNWTGNKARTQVARTMARDTGVGYHVIRNALSTTPASPAKLTYEIGVSGAHIPLAEFHARQARRGVSAAPWGQRRVFPHTFIVEQLGGQVFKREGRARLPIRKLWGPLPIELVRGASPAAFEKSAAADLPQRLAHELGRLFPAPGTRAAS